MDVCWQVLCDLIENGRNACFVLCFAYNHFPHGQIDLDMRERERRERERERERGREIDIDIRERERERERYLGIVCVSTLINEGNFI